jgi:SPP1 gp7 family putative phage head morphogenesis protein
MLPSKAQRTANHVRILRSISIKNRRGRLPKQVYPKLLEHGYAIALTAHVDHARAALAPLLHALPGLLQAAHDERHADADESKRAAALIDQAKRALVQSTQPAGVEAIAQQFGKRTQEFNKVQLGRQVKAALGADVLADNPKVKAALDHFVQENAALIKSIPAQVIDQVEGIVNRAFTSGSLSSDVADEIEQRFNVGESRARLIARDQIGKLYGQTNAIRQQELGVSRFVWRTAGDERVRDEHQELDGEEFDYDDPPDEGLPGEPIQCRCYAEPVFGDIREFADAPDDTEAPAEQ